MNRDADESARSDRKVDPTVRLDPAVRHDPTARPSQKTTPPPIRWTGRRPMPERQPDPREPGSGEVTATVVVAAPIEKVYAAFTAWERQGEWIPMTKVRLVEGDGGQGSVIEAVTSLGPAVLRDEMRVDRVDPPYEVRVVHYRPAVARTGRDAVHAAGWRPYPDGLARVVPGAGRTGRKDCLAVVVARFEGEPEPRAAPVRSTGRVRRLAVVVGFLA